SYVFRPTSGEHSGVDQQIGGFGIYRVGFDFYSAHAWEGSKEYGFLRHGISNIYNVYKSRQP
ncbi:MAG: endoglycosidase, partial [Prevotellaceae bacterium]|nr:endoglycosidase [Prevotellaceae bacterium]